MLKDVKLNFFKSMEEDIIRLYQEAIALIRLRNNGELQLFGDYEINENNDVRFILKWLNPEKGSIESMKFKYAKNHTDALRYFIKCSQNIYNLR